LWIAFQSYHLMVSLGVAFIALTLLGAFLHSRGQLFGRRWLLWLFVIAPLGAWLANETGWVAAEVGRQPWVVYPQLTPPGPGETLWTLRDGLRTVQAVSKSVPASQILASLVIFGVIYVLLFTVWVYILHRKIMKGPEEPGGGAAL
jgi:cytochrome d ubiquinol oxidase subunit I